ncbi:hypothetical protein DM01DRAFT_1075355 [Hesseltinella vesiculosa]|uniref:Coilin n=1 Tax=Hesseltinella vesiculosa TaxID=101127 RepID=A0A1X2GW44_9FUNG|nr:hypothetical protein DM01DRAFT_1075355 [Hesseltinella vesiculosa]
MRIKISSAPPLPPVKIWHVIDDQHTHITSQQLGQDLCTITEGRLSDNANSLDFSMDGFKILPSIPLLTLLKDNDVITVERKSNNGQSEWPRPKRSVDHMSSSDTQASSTKRIKSNDLENETTKSQRRNARRRKLYQHYRDVAHGDKPDDKPAADLHPGSEPSAQPSDDPSVPKKKKSKKKRDKKTSTCAPCVDDTIAQSAPEAFETAVSMTQLLAENKNKKKSYMKGMQPAVHVRYDGPAPSGDSALEQESEYQHDLDQSYDDDIQADQSEQSSAGDSAVELTKPHSPLDDENNLYGAAFVTSNENGPERERQSDRAYRSYPVDNVPALLYADPEPKPDYDQYPAPENGVSAGLHLVIKTLRLAADYTPEISDWIVSREPTHSP